MENIRKNEELLASLDIKEIARKMTHQEAVGFANTENKTDEERGTERKESTKRKEKPIKREKNGNVLFLCRFLKPCSSQNAQNFFTDTRTASPRDAHH